ncbi:YbgA family protein [Atopomonas sediminilitoris]|uniref:YbgA family protein n=1 Tax=Atopomonas sediminilitoris TaxID=2919919 RepID=UPI001F4EF62E|nr:DUF523 and DUF1722 domain-containing protein [Atopomonas sediminilitoris]MCJ8168088.1 DUF523 and DUF1722 domain-containing protein [Atopomonas sediminilitoris]
MTTRQQNSFQDSFEQLGKIKVAISGCLLGQEVRFNGGHKESRLCSRELSEYFDYEPVCPEVGIGLGVPRQTIRLVGEPSDPQALGSTHAEHNVTQALKDYADLQADRLGDICGYIFMQKSPSCGVERVKLYRANGAPHDDGAMGIYAKRFIERHPLVPVEEAGRLNDAVLRENFITRVFAYASWRALCAEGLSKHALVKFHARYKYQLMATAPADYQRLGRLLATSHQQPLDEVAAQYISGMMLALKKTATRKSHCNVLQHISGYLKKVLSSDERQEMQELIEQYRTGLVPLVVPLTLLKHHFRLHPHSYIAQQVYLQPHPQRLGLRNSL